MRYPADLHISPLSVCALRAKGHEISRITDDSLPPAATDLEILSLARRHGAVLITADLDFSDTALIATRGETGPSVISLRLAPPLPGAGHSGAGASAALAPIGTGGRRY